MGGRLPGLRVAQGAEDGNTGESSAEEETSPDKRQPCAHSAEPHIQENEHSFVMSI